jgi:hypothetical protein
VNRDDIIRMATESNLIDSRPPYEELGDALERFAELIAAAERKTCAHMILSQNRGGSPRLYRDTLKLCAMLIKRRKNKPTKENENESNC